MFSCLFGMFWCTYLIFIQITSCVQINKVLISRHPQLEERNITTSILDIGAQPEQESLSIAYCAEICAHLAECASFFFNRLTNQCQFHEDLFMTDDEAIVQPGMQYYYKTKGRSGWCPSEKDFQLLREDGPCVKFHTDKKTLSEANETCMSYTPHSRLVILDNQEKNELVKAAGTAINDQFDTALMIGLLGSNDRLFRWVDGRVLNFADWSSDRVHNRVSNNCVGLYRKREWKWTTLPCRNAHHYICEIVVTARQMMDA